MVPNREPDAGVAHPVERHLAKVEVASSSLVTRSIKRLAKAGRFFFPFPKILRRNEKKILTNRGVSCIIQLVAEVQQQQMWPCGAVG